MRNKTPERYFFERAFGCTWGRVERKEMTVEDYGKLERLFLSGENPPRELIERFYFKAIEEMSGLAESLGKDLWTLEVVSEYWNKYHNQIIDGRKGMYKNIPDGLAEKCKYLEANIISKCPKDHVLVVSYSGKRRIVFDNLVPEAKVGDRVKIHYAYAYPINE